MIYLENSSAIIFRSKDRFGDGSNMASGFPILYEGVKWHSTEALYQASRYDFDIHDGKTIEQHINLESAMAAKKASQKLYHLTVDDWDNKKIDVMEKCLWLKTQQHRDRILCFLDSTKNLDIVEKSYKDDFWGAIPDNNGRLIGNNCLGLLWMTIRETIQ